MNHRLARFDMVLLLVALLGIGMSGCSGDNGGPLPAAQRDIAPQRWQDAKTHIRFGGAASNLTLIARYIAEGMQRRLGDDVLWSMYGGRGFASYVNVVALGKGEVDFALTTPPVSARMGMEGKGYFQKAYPNLRAIATFAQNDWLACVVPAELGVSTFEEVKQRQIPLRVATNPFGTPNAVAFLTEKLFEAHGISLSDLEAWGGGIVPVSGAPEAARKVMSGEANMACHEYWKAFTPLINQMPVKFLPVSEEAMEQLSREFGYQRNTIPKGVYKPNVPERDIPAVDYSDWVVLVNSNVPEEIAYTAAQAAVEDRENGFEILYMGRPPEERSADVPLKPEVMWKNVGVPLHPGAERYYREAGLMP
ncbi:MAG: hypothetical protein IH935_03990 [Acidobacteria bacterium]|nr:hypothetical protein [Acidobacteriota bacterium]